MFWQTTSLFSAHRTFHQHLSRRQRSPGFSFWGALDHTQISWWGAIPTGNTGSTRSNHLDTSLTFEGGGVPTRCPTASDGSSPSEANRTKEAGCKRLIINLYTDEYDAQLVSLNNNNFILTGLLLTKKKVFMEHFCTKDQFILSNDD